MGKIFGNPEPNVAESVKEKKLSEIKYNSQGLEPWGYYDSEIEHFGLNFDRTVPNNEYKKISFKEFAETFLKEKRGRAVAVELGGPGSNLFRGFSNGFFYQTMGITLADLRPDGQKKSDKLKNHIVLEGDIADPSTLRKAMKQLGGGKVDLLIERMIAGHNCLPKEHINLAKVLDMWYRTLNDRALFFCQFEEGVEVWVRLAEKYINENFENKLNMKVHGINFCLIKQEGAPRKFPFKEEYNF